VLRLTGHTSDVYGVKAVPDGRVITAGKSGEVRLHSGEDGRTLRVFEPSPTASNRWVRALCLLDGTSHLLCGGNINGFAVRMLDIDTGGMLMEYRGHGDSVRTVVELSDGATFASCSDDGSVRVWATETGDCNTLQRPSMPSGVERWLLDVMEFERGTVLTACQDRSVIHFDCRTSGVAGEYRGLSGARALARAPNPAHFYCGYNNGIVCCWDARRPDRPLEELRGHSGCIESLTMLPDGRLASTGFEDRTVRVWSAASNQRLTTMAFPACTIGSCAMPDGSLAVGCSDRTAYVVAVETDAEVAGQL